jgi:CrcB protein
MKDLFWITIGAIVGANLRFAISRWAMKYLSASFPYGTLLINVTGCFLLSFFLIWTSERVFVDPRWRALIAIGFCGSYTTLSSYTFETFQLFERGHYYLAFGNFIMNILFCFAAVVAGAALARVIQHGI